MRDTHTDTDAHTRTISGVQDTRVPILGNTSKRAIHVHCPVVDIPILPVTNISTPEQGSGPGETYPKSILPKARRGREGKIVERQQEKEKQWRWLGWILTELMVELCVEDSLWRKSNPRLANWTLAMLDLAPRGIQSRQRT